MSHKAVIHNHRRENLKSHKQKVDELLAQMSCRITAQSDTWIV
jgi:hypothetical protein